MSIKRPTLNDRGQSEADIYEKILDASNEIPIMKFFEILDEGSQFPLSFFPSFVGLFGEYLSPIHISQFVQVFEKLETLLLTRLSAGNTTFLQTDSHFWNFLYPKDKVRDQCVIFDCSMWRTGFGGCDLAYNWFTSVSQSSSTI
jgi:hypothetical protein